MTSWILFIMFVGQPTAVLHLPDGADITDCTKQAFLQKRLHPTATFACFPYVRGIV